MPSGSAVAHNGQDASPSPVSVYVRVRPVDGQNGEKIVARRENLTSLKLNEKSGQSRSYAFDHVFGPEDDQETVYKSTTAPVLEEVLNGYSCTVFAYGQTGTGKTYTMTGDTESEKGCGIIPRALKTLFKHLKDKSIKEHVVRTTFVELYNEEIIDLLSAKENNDVKLKLFDDKDGNVKIQGAEDKLVHHYEEAMKVFDEGNKRRRTAETNMNVESSRSHAVFILTIYMKETSIDNSEIVKQGKLNLVDLAGSENIAKSGATDKRKREAGNINQSLLTLGRVINSLTDSNASTHIPYRESKLTRLLKDSLGGKTKTTMIATVSPVIKNYDETHSTLEYAFRSKNIKNKPVINKKVTQLGLVKDMSDELEKTRKNLLATQTKNGIYLDPENYEEMIKKQESLSEKINQLTESLNEKELLLEKNIEEFKNVNALLSYYENIAPTYYDNCLKSNKICTNLIEACNDYKKQAITISKTNTQNSNIHHATNKAAKTVVESLKNSSSELNKKTAQFKIGESEANQQEYEETDGWSRNCAFKNDQVHTLLKEDLKNVENTLINYLNNIEGYFKEELEHNSHIVKTSLSSKTSIVENLNEFSVNHKQRLLDFQTANEKFQESTKNSIQKFREHISEFTNMENAISQTKSKNDDTHENSSQMLSEIKKMLTMSLDKLKDVENVSNDGYLYADKMNTGFQKIVKNTKVKFSENLFTFTNSVNENTVLSDTFFKEFGNSITNSITKFEGEILESFQKVISMNEGSAEEIGNQKKILEKFFKSSSSEFKKFIKVSVQNVLNTFTEQYKVQSEAVLKDNKKRSCRVSEFRSNISNIANSFLKSFDKVNNLLHEQDKLNFVNVTTNNVDLTEPKCPIVLKSRNEILYPENTIPEAPLAKRKKSQ